MLLRLDFRCVRYSFKLLYNCHINYIIRRDITMSQKTLLSFFKPPKASSNVLTAVNNAKEIENSNASADSLHTTSSPKHRKRVRQLVESDDENVEKDQCLNGAVSGSPVRSSQSVDSETTKEQNISQGSADERAESETVPLRMTARKTMPSPYMKKLLSGIKNGPDESTAKLGTAEKQSMDVEMKEFKDESSESEDKISGNGTVGNDSETAADIQKEDDSRCSKKSASPQKKVPKTDSTSTDEEDKPIEQTEKVTASSKSSGSQKKSDSKKRKKSEEKSPEEGSPKKPKKRGRAKKTVEPNDKEVMEKKKAGSSSKGAKRDSETNTKALVEKSSEDKKEKKLIHNFFARTSAPKFSSSSNPPAQDESTSSNVKSKKPSPKSKTATNEPLDTEVKDQVITDIQKEKQSSRDSGSGSKKADADKEGKDENQMPVIESPKKQKRDDSKKLEKKGKDKCPEESSPMKQKKARCAKRIIESEDEEEGSEGKDSNDEKSDDDCGVIEQPKSPVREKKEKTPVHSFFAPKTKEDKNEKTSSQKKESKTSGSEKDTVYDPTKRHYHPVDDAFWKKGEKVPYLALARTLEEIENISGRLKIIEMLANYFRSVIVLSPDDLLPSVYLCVNRIAPEYEGIELGVGETLLMKAVAQATGRTLDKIKAETAVKGDLGLVAESSRGNQRYMFAPPKLTVASVFAKFREIALMSGNAAMSKKVDKIQALFVACRNCEARYIIRSLSGKLRIGLAEQSVLAALAQAAVLTPPNQPYPPEILNSSSKSSSESFKKKLDAQTLILKTTYCECPNYDKIIPVLLKEGIEGLPNHCYLTPGIPLKPMLAHPTKGIDEVLQRFDGVDFTCEFKYDGERAQIHIMESGDVKIYSRNQEDNTSKYPDIISRISKVLKPETKSCVIDTEAVAWDRDAKQILPFQQLSTRKRKDVQESEIKVQVCVVAFDLIFLNGKSLIKLPLKERRKLLRESFIEVENEFMFVHCTDGNTADVMQEFLEESIKGNCEGLMVKSLEVDASYEIAKRSHNWLKLKKDYLDGVGDTLDLVVIGGYHGRGKRTGAYGGFLLACYDDENEEFQTICKIGTGFKDEKLESHTSFLKDHVINEPKSYFRFDSSLTPDVWFEPVQVWEVKCADLSKSPVHKAAVGIIDPEKGISLRFPRFLRIRDDKKPEDATTATQVARLYNSQEQIQNQKSKETKVEDDDFY